MKNELLIAQFAATATAPVQEQAAGRRKELVFYSGTEIERYDFWNDEDYTIQFSMKDGDYDFARLNHAPLLKDHWAFSVDAQVGHVENARIEKGVAMATAVFAETADVNDLWEKIDAGHVRNVSMGVEIERLELVSKPKEKKRYMCYGWSPREISVVPLGADPGASFVFAQRHLSETMPDGMREFLRELYRDRQSLSELIASRESLGVIVARHLAETGAAGTADQQSAHRLRLALQRQRQYELN